MTTPQGPYENFQQAGAQPWIPVAPGRPPQPPQRPRKKRPALIAGIVAVALVAAGGVTFGIAHLVGKRVDAAFPEAKYRLVVPKAVLDEEFTLSEDLSDTEGRRIEDALDLSVRDTEGTVAQYASDEGGDLVFSGLSGRLATPGHTRGQIMRGAAHVEGAEVAVPAKEFTPDGYGITVTCQVLLTTTAEAVTTTPMCAWADGNTAAMIAVMRPGTGRQDPLIIDLKKLARETAQVRSEVRQPIG